MHITEISSQVSFGSENFLFKNTATGLANGKTSRAISDVDKTTQLGDISDNTEARPVQQRPLTRADNSGYMPFFRTSQPESIPAPLLEAPAFNATTPAFSQYDITVNDPEFQTPDFKPKTLATIIKTYCKSFRSMFSINSPLIDRSDRVEKLRHRLFGVLQVVLASAVATGLLVAGFMGSALYFHLLFPAVEALSEPALWIIFTVFACPLVVTLVFLILITNGLVIGVTYPITAAVAACVDTYERLSQNNETPEEKFINKYRRMEKQLAYLKELYHYILHEKSCPGGNCPGSGDSDNRADLSTFEQIEKALRQADLWSERAMLSMFYAKKDVQKELDECILTIEQWLENAKKQKDIICNGVEMDVLNRSGR